MGKTLIKTLLAVAIPIAFASYALAGVSLPYSGRLTFASGQPETGPLTLDFRFYEHATGGTALGGIVLRHEQIELKDGVFSIALELSDADAQVILASQELWIEVTDVTHGKTFPRQRLGAVPFALRLPVDANTLAFDAQGNLTLVAPPEDGKFLTSSGGTLTWATLGGGGDMATAVYDANANGKVDVAESALQADDALKLNGKDETYFRNASNINAGTLAETFIDPAIARDSEIPQSTDDVAEGANNLYYTDARATAAARAAISGSGPISVNASGVISISNATTAAAGAMSAADKQKLDGIDLTTISEAHADRMKWDGGSSGLNPATARQSLGLEIGTDVQAYDVALQSIADLTTAADQLLYTTGPDTFATWSLTAAGRALLDDADAAAQRATLGLGTISTQDSDDVDITGGNIAGVTLKLGNDTAACDASKAGTVRFDDTALRLELCDNPLDTGWAWTPLQTRITSDLTLTVTAGDCQSLIDTLTGLDEAYIAPSATVTIALPDGTYNCTETIMVDHSQGHRLRIIGNESNPNNVTINSTAAIGINVLERGLGYLNGVHLVHTGGLNDAKGVRIQGGSVTFGTAVRISDYDGSLSYCILITRGSLTIDGPDATNKLVLSNCFSGIAAAHKSSFYGPYTQATGVTPANGTGFIANFGSHMDVQYASASNYLYGYLAEGNGSIRAPNTTASSVARGYGSFTGSYIDAASSSASSISLRAYIAQGGFLDSPSCTITNAGGGFGASQNGHIRANGCSLTNVTNQFDPLPNTFGNAASYIYR